MATKTAMPTPTERVDMRSYMLDTTEMADFTPEELEEIRLILDKIAKTMQHAQALDNEVEERLPGYWEGVKTADAAKKQLVDRFRMLVGMRRPNGGLSLRYGPLAISMAKSEPSYAADPRGITEEVTKKYGDIHVDDRPLFTWTMDDRVLAEAIRRGLVPLDELVDAGVIVVSQRTPAISPKLVRGGG